SWPTLVLIDPEGYLVGTVSGEGNYEALDKTIGSSIQKLDAQGKLNHQPLKLALEKDKVQDKALSFPGKIIADADNNRLFISDSGHNRIIIAQPDGKVIDVIGSGIQGTTDGTFDQAAFHHPQGMCYRDGELYIADNDKHKLR